MPLASARAALSFAVFALATARAAPCTAAAPLPNLGAGAVVSHIQGVDGTAIVQPLGGVPVAAVELWFRAPSIGFGSRAIPGLARVAAQTVATSKPIIGPALGEMVSGVGGSLSISAFGDSVAVSALVPSNAASETVKTMTTAYFSPVVTEDGYRSALRDVATESLLASFDPSLLLRDAVLGALFASGPKHYPPLGTAKEITTITIGDARSFASRAFRAQNAVLIVSGAVTSAVTMTASPGRAVPPGDAAGALVESWQPSPVSAAPAAAMQTSTDPGAAYAWAGPPITRQDEATAMDFIADYLFRPDSGAIAQAIADRFPAAFVSGQFITLHDAGVLVVSFGDADVPQLRAVIDRRIDAMRSPLDPATFAAARTAFEYHLLSDLQTPSEMADNFGWYSVEGAPEYAPGVNGREGAYLRAADALTPAFIAGVAQKYLAKAPATASLEPPPKAREASAGGLQ